VRGGGDLSRRSVTIRLQRAQVAVEQEPKGSKMDKAG
jgi:hypothetical protein